jgi:cytochrome c-type biogenesis protein CcmF
VGVVLIALGAGSSTPGLIAYTFSAFVIAAIGLEFVRGTKARRALSSESWPGAFFSLIGRNRRRYGGYIVHFAIVLLAIGIAGSSSYDSVVEGKLAQGQSLSVSGYKVTYQRLTERETPHAAEVRAHLLVSRNGKTLGPMEAGKNSYKIAGPDPQVSSEVGIRTNYLTGEDLFVIPEQVNDDGTVYFRIFVKPLVNLIWLAGLVFLLGSIVALWPDAREQRRLAVRYDEVGTTVRGK